MGEQVALVLGIFDLTGVFANAIIGGVIAREEKLDPVGFVSLAVLSGLGGGVIRDVLLQHGPPAALVDIRYLTAAIVGAAISFLVNIRGRALHWTWPVIDAVALGCWASAGAAKTLGAGLGWLPAILLGVVTAVGGGVARDVLLRRVPGVLGGNTLYATAAAMAAAVLVILARMGWGPWAQVGGVVAGAGLCLLARWRGWVLPDADAWSPRRMVASATSWRGRGRRRRTPRKSRRDS